MIDDASIMSWYCLYVRGDVRTDDSRYKIVLHSTTVWVRTSDVTVFQQLNEDTEVK